VSAAKQQPDNVRFGVGGGQPTRVGALTHARAAYAQLVARVLAGEFDDARFVRSLATSWDERLAFLAQFRSDASLSEETRAALDFLTENILTAQIEDSEAMVQWLDAYPNAVAELFPPSALTFDVIWQSGDPGPLVVSFDHAAA
jgi:hypothetical protein